MLPWLYRLYFWGIHGMFGEVVFSAIWEFVVSGKWQFMGTTSLWSFLVYGLGTCFAGEYAHSYMHTLRMPLLVRCLLYVVMIYIWEFICGLILDAIGARSWDYTHYDYDFMGLITLEYAPGWFFAGLYFEYIMSIMKKLEQVPRWKRKD